LAGTFGALAEAANVPFLGKIAPKTDQKLSD